MEFSPKKLDGMIKLSIFAINKISEKNSGRVSIHQHAVQGLILFSDFLFIGHSSFDTVLHQKQRWIVWGMIQRGLSTPRMKGKNISPKYRKAVAVGNLWGNKSALGKVPVEGITFYSQLPYQSS